MSKETAPLCWWEDNFTHIEVLNFLKDLALVDGDHDALSLLWGMEALAHPRFKPPTLSELKRYDADFLETIRKHEMGFINERLGCMTYHRRT